MPKRRHERHEPTHEWQQIQLLLKDTAQINYEVIRPLWTPRRLMLDVFGQSKVSKKRAERQTSLEQANLDSGEIGGGVFAEAPLLSASFLPLP